MFVEAERMPSDDGVGPLYTVTLQGSRNPFNDLIPHAIFRWHNVCLQASVGWLGPVSHPWSRVMRKTLLATAVLVGPSVLWAASASAAPVYVGLSTGTATPTTTITGAGGAPSTSNSANGTFSFPDTAVVTGVYASGTVTGTPPDPEPELVTTSLDFSGGPNNGTETISIYVTELNQETLNFNAFISSFSAVYVPSDLPPSGNPAVSITESTYVTPCTTLITSGPYTGGCSPAAYAFATQDLLDTVTYNSITTTPSTTVDAAPVPGNLATPFATTEVYTVTFDPKYGDVDASIVLTVPEPASLALLGTACVGLGLFRRRRAAPADRQA